MSELRRVAFVGDVHLERDDPELEPFLGFLDRLGGTVDRIVLMGDLFNIWVGRRAMEQSHHRAVVERLTELRRRGVGVRYVEGNRDYRIAGLYAGSALDDASERGLEERVGAHRIIALHGDEANLDDRQYRRWRRFSRSAPVWGLFRALPRPWAIRFADRLEARFRGTNLAFKAEFPESVVRAYARDWIGRGFDTVVLGHFHVERDLTVDRDDGSGRVLVLPEWKGSRRFLLADADSGIRFVDA